jgi:hypothetical protein
MRRKCYVQPLTPLMPILWVLLALLILFQGHLRGSAAAAAPRPTAVVTPTAQPVPPVATVL